METAQSATIAERAYHIWQEQGRPHGRDLDHWLQAEREIAESARPARPATRKASRSPTPRASRSNAAARKPKAPTT